jgi:hypothetical protein
MTETRFNRLGAVALIAVVLAFVAFAFGFYPAG